MTPCFFFFSSSSCSARATFSVFFLQASGDRMVCRDTHCPHLRLTQLCNQDTLVHAPSLASGPPTPTRASKPSSQRCNSKGCSAWLAGGLADLVLVLRPRPPPSDAHPPSLSLSLPPTRRKPSRFLDPPHPCHPCCAGTRTPYRLYLGRYRL